MAKETQETENKDIKELKKQVEKLRASLKLANKKIFNLQKGFSSKQVNEIKKIINNILP